MGRVKSYYWDQLMQDEDIWEYQMIMHQEEALKEEQKNFKMSDEEYKYYQLYMEDKLCLDQTNSYQDGQKDNLLNGRVKDGPKLRKARSKR